jgi:hypothetical protein
MSWTSWCNRLFPFLILFEHCVMMSMLCNCCVRELLILARTWFAFGLPSKTGCDSYSLQRWSDDRSTATSHPRRSGNTLRPHWSAARARAGGSTPRWRPVARAFHKLLHAWHSDTLISVADWLVLMRGMGCSWAFHLECSMFQNTPC